MTSNPLHKLEIYQTANGKRPYEEWLKRLSPQVQTRIDLKISTQVANGGGSLRNLDADLFEIKFSFGPGYRVYCGKVGQTLIIILCGGDKSTQSKDISKAREYWHDYKQRIL